MNFFRSRTILLACVFFVLQGCGGPSPEQSKKPAEPTPQANSEAEANLQKARAELTLLQQQNDKLAQRCEVLTVKTTELEEIVREKEVKGAPAPPATTAGSDARIELMGAKAIAEYRAKQLSARLDLLSKDLERKDQELEAIKKAAEQKEAEVAALKKSMEQLRITAETQTADLTRRMEQLGTQVHERSEATKKLQKEVDEKSALLESLKSAVADAGKVKSFAESQAAQLRTQLDETLKQLQAARAESQQRTSEATDLRNQFTNLNQEMAQWRGAAERFRAEAERYAQALQELQTQASDLTTRLKTLESSEERIWDEEYIPPLTEQITVGPMLGLLSGQTNKAQ
jgi:chromosome segregation protein